VKVTFDPIQFFSVKNKKIYFKISLDFRNQISWPIYSICFSRWYN